MTLRTTAQRKPVFRRHVLALAACSALAAGPVAADRLVWVGGSDGDWAVDTHWSAGRAPGFNDTVFLGAFDTWIAGPNKFSIRSFDGTGRLTLDKSQLSFAEASTIGGLVLSGGVLDGTGALRVTGSSLWTAGRINSVARTQFLGPLTIDGAGQKQVGTGLLELADTTWAGGDIDLLGPGGIVVNTGLFTVSAANHSLRGYIDSNDPARDSVFYNQGRFLKTGAGTSNLLVHFQNKPTSSLRVDEGTLLLGADAGLSGDVRVAAGARLELGWTNQATLLDMDGSASRGELLVTNRTYVARAVGQNEWGGLLALRTSPNPTGPQISLHGGRLSVDGQLTTAGLELRASDIYFTAGGEITGSGALTVKGAAIWTGAFTGSGTTLFEGPVVLGGGSGPVREDFDLYGSRVLFGGNPTWLSGRTVTFADTATLLGPVSVSDGGRLVNRGSFVEGLAGQYNYYDLPQSNGSRHRPQPAFSGSGFFDNQALYRKTGGWSELSVSFANLAGATLAVDAGELVLSGGSYIGGTVQVAPGGSLRLAGTALHQIDGIDSSTSLGQLVLDGNANFTRATHFGGTLALVTGTYALNASLDVALLRFDPVWIGGVGWGGGPIFELHRGKFTGAGLLSFGNTMSWTGGSVWGPLNTRYTGPLTISAGDNRVLGKNLILAGGTQWSGGTIVIGGNGSITNTASFADLNSQDSSIAQAFESGTRTFINAGTYTKSGGGRTTVTTNFVNKPGATLALDSGTLFLEHGSDLSGVVTVAQGSALLLGNRGTHTWDTLDAKQGPGLVEVQGAQVTATGNNSFHTLRLSGDTNLVANGSLAVNRLEMRSYDASLRGNANVDVEVLDWRGGEFADAGTTTVSGTATIGAGTNQVLLGRSLVFKGDTQWSGGTIVIGGNGSITNTASFADLNSQDSSIAQAFESGTRTFINAGTYTKSGGGRTTVTTNFVNKPGATLALDSGTLFLEHGSDLSGVVTVAQGSALLLGNRGTHTWDTLDAKQGPGLVEVQGAQVTATGNNSFHTLRLSGDTNLVANGSLAVNRLEMRSYDASLRGNANVDVEVLDWRGGEFADAGTTTVSGTATIGAGTNQVLLGRSLVFKGDTQWNGGRIVIGPGSRITNEGIFADLNSADSAIEGDGRQAAFENSGSFVKSGLGNTTIQPTFVLGPAGHVRVEAGTLTLNGLVYQPGEATGGASVTPSAGRGAVPVGAAVSGETLGQAVAAAGTLPSLAGASFTVLAGAALVYGGSGVTTNTARITLDGPGSQIRLLASGADALASLTGNAAGAALTLRNGRDVLSAGAFSNAGLLQVGASSRFSAGGGVTNATGASLLLDGGSLGPASPAIGTPGSASGLVNLGLVAGSGQVMSIVENRRGGQILARGGVLTLAETVNNAGVLGAEAGGTLLLARELSSPTGTLQLSGGTIDTGGHGLRNDGGIVGFGTLRVALLDNAGLMQFGAGSTQVDGAVNNLAGGRIVVSAGGAATFQGAVQALAGSEIRVSNNALVVFSARVTQANGAAFAGAGSSYFEGELSIGNSPGAGGAEGNVFFGSGNLYRAEIGGLLAGTGFDHFSVGGHHSFGGTLMVSNWGGFEPQAGQTFDLFDWGTASGHFTRIDFSAAPLSDGLRWDTSRLYSTGEIGVMAAVPELGTWALWLSGLAALGVMARRRA